MAMLTYEVAADRPLAIRIGRPPRKLIDEIWRNLAVLHLLLHRQSDQSILSGGEEIE